MVDKGQLEQFRNQEPIWKRRSNQRYQIKVFKGAIENVKKFQCKLWMLMPELKQLGPN
jgi:hypothetical protein